VPITHYFIVVGGTLAASLLIAGWYLPATPAMFSHQLIIDRSIIRIKSAHKWPEKIVLDTSRPIVTPPTLEEPPAAKSVRLQPDEAGDRSNLEAMAELNPDPPLAAVDHPPLRNKRGLAKIARSKPGARGPVTRRLAKAERSGGCCQLQWIDNGQTRSTALSRKHIASSSSMGWPALTGGIER
jgi:hypothetical protein